MVSLRDAPVGQRSMVGLGYQARSESYDAITRNEMRRLDDAAVDDGYVFPSPFLTCRWSQDEDDNGVVAITQSCDYIVPNATDNEGEDPFT
eukprot:CAMPEP_0117066862 /NCGR_PEP_ID=MMETSP0472-20121206/46781_1 /TAXON_ID=693140 ORGANISM="Tiarina fusus, Strain LIS" /NCGR_SAMPLE_ID=MMETSP0472 /ASSEMBLY_ACC=CAM_ASM_000603 /LENGTH=90 /DNA_ID=CAMNT_0004788133 /DNA_START=82 /DNA_END=350 /DNA_ORIENTATION=+